MEPNNAMQGPFQWPQDALRPQTGKAPTELSQIAQPTVNFDQDGWGHVDTTVQPFSWSFTGGTPGTLDLLLGIATNLGAAQPQHEFQLCVLAVSAVLSGTGGIVGDGWLQYRAGSDGVAVVHSRATVLYNPNIGGALRFDSIGVGSRRWLPYGHLWVPPGFRPQFRYFGDVGGSQTLTVSGAVGRLRRGFRAGAP